MSAAAGLLQPKSVRAGEARPHAFHRGPPHGLTQDLGFYSEGRALHLFRSGFDTVDIASRLGCTPAAAANAVARARDEERRAG